VNDLASINIDAKLLKKTNSFDSALIDTLELQNGCICCSLADDMITSIRQFLHMAEENGVHYDHILLECSGIAEPRRVKEIFREVTANPLSDLSTAALDTLVTVIDAKVFVDLFGTDDSVAQHRRLAVGAATDAGDGDDDDDDADADAAEGSGGTIVEGAPMETPKVDEGFLEESSGMRSITELLLEQVECADVILISKSDLLEDPARDLARLRLIISSLNPTARVELCEHGAVSSPLDVIGSAGGKGMVALDVIMEHKNSILAAERAAAAEAAAAAAVKHDTSCSHSSHSHSHAHRHTDYAAHCGAEAAAAAADCYAPHDHNSPSPSHDHDHDHEEDEETTALRRFGISSFVYKRRRPFHPTRFNDFLQNVGEMSFKEISEFDPAGKPISADGSSSPAASKLNLLRSKGFLWMANTSNYGYYLSHSGQHMGMSILGNWWADIPRADWPAAEIEDILSDFDGEHGDRRQELIFIGQFKDVNEQRKLEKELDACLLTAKEMKQYNEALHKEDPSELLSQIFE
jgi:G3E family GTPase